MMCKLALRNVKRMAKDYVVYFMTMAVVTALMFSFNTLLFSKDVQNLFQMDAMMSVMTGLATAFIVPIIAWLINYMVRFVLEKRSREFGIYLLVGVKKKEIARLYFTENLLLGAGAFLVGMGLGLLFQQILLSIFYSMVQLDYKLHLEWNRNCILMTAACYLGCYLLALFRSRKKFRKMNIHDLMESQRQNEEIKETHEKAKRWFLPLSVLFLVVFGVFLFCFKAWDTGVVIAFLIGLVLTIDPVCNTKDFRHLRRNHDNGLSLFCHLYDQVINFIFCADINSSCRFIHHKHLRFTLEPLSKNNLLLVSSGKT